MLEEKVSPNTPNQTKGRFTIDLHDLSLNPALQAYISIRRIFVYALGDTLL
jgi:hypothetical protein